MNHNILATKEFIKERYLDISMNWEELYNLAFNKMKNFINQDHILDRNIINYIWTDKKDNWEYNLNQKTHSISKLWIKDFILSDNFSDKLKYLVLSYCLGIFKIEKEKIIC